MTTYITITDAETDPEAPLTSELAKKWRDNPIAIAEGDPAAPPVLGSARRANRLGQIVIGAGDPASIQITGLAPHKAIIIETDATLSWSGNLTIQISWDNGTSWRTVLNLASTVNQNYIGALIWTTNRMGIGIGAALNTGTTAAPNGVLQYAFGDYQGAINAVRLNSSSFSSGTIGIYGWEKGYSV